MAELARSKTPEAIETLVACMDFGNDGRVRVMAAEAILDRGWGKVAVNERESRHSHCPGILRLGLWASLPDEALQETVRRLLASPELRAEMSTTSRAAVDGWGGRRIAQAIEALLEDR